MKIGIDCRAAQWYRGTGIGNYTYQLISSLNNFDTTNDYTLYFSEGFKSKLSLKQNYRVNLVEDRCSSDFWTSVLRPCISNTEDIELFHVPQNGIGLPYDKQCKYIITLHDIIPHILPETVSKGFLEIFQREMPGIIQKCSGIITVSEYSKSDIAKAFNYPSENIFVTSLFAHSTFKPMNKKMCKKIMNIKHGIPEDFILYTGGFSPRKNILALIEGYSKYSYNNKNSMPLVIAGTKGSSYPLYRDRAGNLGIINKVYFTGQIAQDFMPHLYNAAKFFIYPSLYEGFGLPPLEAMACGTPVIATNKSSVPEVLSDAAFYIEPEDRDCICNALKRLDEDYILRKLLVKKGLLRARTLNEKKTITKTIDAYMKVNQSCY